VVVPVKRLSLAKTRLSSYGDDGRRALALAFAADVVEATARVARVLVVTDDEDAAAVVTRLGAEVTADDPDAGLNPALVHGAELLRSSSPELGVATLSADLPALRDAHLRDVLGDVEGHAFVADLEGSGTTLLAAAPGLELDPRFGPSSREAHLASGATALVAPRGMRCDVDTPTDLLLALALGVGRHTAAAAAALGIVTAAVTVKTWDTTAGGSAYRDDGSVLELPPDSLQDSGFRFLRVGQRVRAATAPDATTRLALP
jgi:2-phospho-L-lactate guanylyltransferase